MADMLTPLPPYEEEGYLTAEPAIEFTIKRNVNAGAKKIFCAWTDSEMFKRWIVPPNQELTSFSLKPKRETIWQTKEFTDSNCTEYLLQTTTLFLNESIEAVCFVSTVPGMMRKHPVYLLLTLKEQQSGDGAIFTRYELTLSYHHATLWRHTSRVDLHTFWLEATERLNQLLEYGIAAAPAAELMLRECLAKYQTGKPDSKD